MSFLNNFYIVLICILAVCVCVYVGVGDLPATRPGLLLTDLGPAGKLNGIRTI